MNINDYRGKQEHLSWDQLQAGEVYIDVKHQKYVINTDEDYVVDLSSGIVYNDYDYKGVTENFIHCPNATLEIK